MEKHPAYVLWRERTLAAPPFALKLDGRPFAPGLPTRSRQKTARGGELTREDVYALPGGLEATLRWKEPPGFDAVEWYLTLANRGAADSALVTELKPCATALPLSPDPPAVPGWRPPPGITRLHWAKGSQCEADDFFPRSAPLLPGQTLAFAPQGGRSSDGVLPFFDVNRGEEGVLCAVGWTGQWNAAFTRTEGGVALTAAMEDGCFRLRPGECVRTPSMVLLFYGGGQNRGRNLLRKLIRDHYSPFGRPGGPEHPPLALSSWGGMSTAEHLEHLAPVLREDCGFEFYWVDAGWYGDPQGDSPSEFVGDWYTQAGDWRPNRRIHPDGLAPLMAAVRAAGLGPMLWFETERALPAAPVPREHPEWFLSVPGNDSLLLNLGCPEALAYAVDLVGSYVEELGLNCYRQDFNFEPLAYWRAADGPERRGISEMKHIAGLYAFWDALLERFPHLLIDNCASGGRRIDIETLRRSVPLWRSDVQCVWDVDPEAAQCHTAGLSAWAPYWGTGAGCARGDTYRARSAYGPGLAVNYWGYGGWFPNDDEPWDWVRAMTAEYKRVRPFMSGDYYPLLPPSTDPAGWAAWQFDRPDLQGGVVLAFRRAASPLTLASLPLTGLPPGRTCRLEDGDTGSTRDVPTDDLLAGLEVCLPLARSSQILFYTLLD